MLQQQDIEIMKTNLINSLRAMEGLPPKKAATRTVKNIQYLINPEAATVTEYKIRGEFVALNLNGGDSLGYFHPIARPDIIFNFKDEDNYRTEDIDPDYYAIAKRLAKKAIAETLAQEKAENIEEAEQKQNELLDEAHEAEVIHYCVFRDQATDHYYAGYHDFGLNRNFFDKTSSKDKCADFLAQHSIVDDLDVILTWRYEFKPDTLTVFDYRSGFVNQFEPTEYMRNAKEQASPSVPKNIERVVLSALGGDQELYTHFLNWMAVIFQYRINTQSAWVLQGTTGTGKGALFHQIIAPLLGEDYCRIVTLANLEDQFNQYFEKCLVLFVDEVDTDQIKNVDKLIAKVKNMITEPKLAVRAMRTDLRETKSHINIMMASNRPNSVRVEENDRRFNVCQRQENKLIKEDEDADALFAAVQDELQDFADYLLSHKADKALARSTIENEAKRQLQTTTQTAIEEVAQALSNGDLRYFFEQRPRPNSNSRFDSHNYFDISRHYTDMLFNAVDAHNNSNSHVLRHDDLFAIFEGLVGKMPSTKIKLTKRLNHAGIRVGTQTTDNTSVRGYRAKWKAAPEDVARWSAMLMNELTEAVMPPEEKMQKHVREQIATMQANSAPQKDDPTESH